jgi:hypothetical protein
MKLWFPALLVCFCDQFAQKSLCQLDPHSDAHGHVLHYGYAAQLPLEGAKSVDGMVYEALSEITPI